MGDVSTGPYFGHYYYKCNRVKEDERDEDFIAFFYKIK